MPYRLFQSLPDDSEVEVPCGPFVFPATAIYLIQDRFPQVSQDIIHQNYTSFRFHEGDAYSFHNHNLHFLVKEIAQ